MLLMRKPRTSHRSSHGRRATITGIAYLRSQLTASTAAGYGLPRHHPLHHAGINEKGCPKACPTNGQHSAPLVPTSTRTGNDASKAGWGRGNSLHRRRLRGSPPRVGWHRADRRHLVAAGAMGGKPAWPVGERSFLFRARVRQGCLDRAVDTVTSEPLILRSRR